VNRTNSLVHLIRLIRRSVSAFRVVAPRPERSVPGRELVRDIVLVR
jgi:hypothetical protein